MNPLCQRHTSAFIPVAPLVLLAALCCLWPPAAAGENGGDYRYFPGAPMDDRALKVQERAEDLYASGDYERALFLYEKELAPKGDKYAQYMVGFMHLTGKGTAKDPVEGLAWYRLAAERGEESFVMARDALRQSLGPAARREARGRFAGLWQRFGDRRLLLELIKNDIALLQRLAGGSAETDSRSAIVSGYSGDSAEAPHYHRVRKRLAERLDYLESTAGANDTEIVFEPSAIEALEASVLRELEALELPGSLSDLD